jgi:hypothetical protein
MATFEILSLCNFLLNPVINFVSVIAWITHPELNEIIWSVHIRAIRILAYILMDRILVIFTEITNPAL